MNSAIFWRRSSLELKFPRLIIPCSNLKGRNQTKGPMASVFKCDFLRKAWPHGLGLLYAHQCLDASLFICGDEVNGFFDQGLRLQIEIADAFSLIFILGAIINFRIQPILAFVRLQITLIKKPFGLPLGNTSSDPLQMNFIG